MTPTLLEQLVANQTFWGILGLVALAGLTYHTTEILKAWHARDAKDEEQGPPTPDTCAIDGCTNPVAISFYSPTGVLYVCVDCSGRVSEWTGPAIDQEAS